MYYNIRVKHTFCQNSNLEKFRKDRLFFWQKVGLTEYKIVLFILFDLWISKWVNYWFFFLNPCDSYGSVLDWQWLLFPVISDKRSSTAANFVGSNMTSEVGKQLKWTIWRFDNVSNQMSLWYLVFSFLEEKRYLWFFPSELNWKSDFGKF